LRAKAIAENLELQMLTPRLKVVWGGIIALSIFVELAPIPVMPPLVFYLCQFAKGILFAAIGYLAPLTFLRLGALSRGIMLAAISVVIVESLQGIVLRGHGFHLSELTLKLLLLFVGFALALDVRYQRVIAVGPLRIRLIEECSS
jgi:hypothetical protein